jgi:hypothetical protein
VIVIGLPFSKGHHYDRSSYRKKSINVALATLSPAAPWGCQARRFA